jgi:hypothetical protein
MYEYRDKAGHVFAANIVLAGEMTDGLWQRMKRATDAGSGRFIAHQVRLPEVFAYLPGDHIRDPVFPDGYPYDPANDHCWHTLHRDAWQLTDEEPAEERTVEELVTEFDQCRQRWQPFDPAIRFRK